MIDTILCFYIQGHRQWSTLIYYYENKERESKDTVCSVVTVANKQIMHEFQFCTLGSSPNKSLT